MTYRAIGLMSGSSLDGLDIVFAEFVSSTGDWSFEIKMADCIPYSREWKSKLGNATTLNALDYQLLHTEYGHHTGKLVNRFIEQNNLSYQVALIGSHGHTTFHMPEKSMTAQLGDGAAIAAQTSLPVVSDLRSLDVAFGGQGAPIVPIGEKYLFKEYQWFLNIGGIANISFNQKADYTAFDICPANRVLNMLAAKTGNEFDEGGKIAASGNVHYGLLSSLNKLDYYAKTFPKSLANNFGTHVVFPLIEDFKLSPADALRTYIEHIVKQVINSVLLVKQRKALADESSNHRMLVTGGGAFNSFLMARLSEGLTDLNIDLVLPSENIIKYKEALIIAFIAVLRWRQEYNVLASVTGAERDSIGGAVWVGQEA